MEPIVDFIKKIFSQPKRILFFLLCCIIFVVVLFPFGDLSDYASSMISKGTNNSVYVQFEDMSFTALPQPGIKMSQVVVESAMAPELEFNSLSVAPSLLGIMDLIKGKPAGRAYAEGLFRGDLDIAVGSSSKIKEKTGMNVDLAYSNIDMKSLTGALKQSGHLPFTASGTGQLMADVDLATDMKVQPDGTFQLNVRKPQIPSFSLPLGAFGSLPLPGLSMDSLKITGEIKNGRITIKEGVLGNNKNDLFGTISGTIDVQLGPGGRVKRMGLYDLAIDLSLKKSLSTQLGAMTAFISQYKSQTLTGSRYRFRAKGQVGRNPQFTPM